MTVRKPSPRFGYRPVLTRPIEQVGHLQNIVVNTNNQALSMLRLSMNSHQVFVTLRLGQPARAWLVEAVTEDDLRVAVDNEVRAYCRMHDVPIERLTVGLSEAFMAACLPLR